MADHEGAEQKGAEQKDGNFELPTWLQPDGIPVSCIEKIKVLNENLEEMREIAQDALGDGILMGCDERQIRNVLLMLVDSLENPYANKGNDKS